jgi:probable rRNA maturation factor
LKPLSLILLNQPVPGVTAAMLARFLGRARRAAGLAGEVTVLVASSAELCRLNRRFRRQNHPTDVLSFPSAPQRGKTSRVGYLGDIAISAAMARRNGKLLGHGAAAEIKILILHGLLHLAGYDHESDNGRMASRELRLRRQLNLPQTLIERAAPRPGRPRPGAVTAGSKRIVRSAAGVRRSRQT